MASSAAAGGAEGSPQTPAAPAAARAALEGGELDATAFLGAAGHRRRGSGRVVLAAGVCWCLFVNHYARDVTGALEREIEADVGIDAKQYQALNSAYFGPNIVAPLLAGALAQRAGAPNMLLATQALAALGHVIVGIGAQARCYGALLAGRIILGLTYESIDVMPLPILAPHFGDAWGALVGLFNGALRMGSVVNFALSPLAYGLGGLPAALWLSGLVGLSGLAAAVAVRRVEARLPKAAPAARGEDAAAAGSEDAGASAKLLVRELCLCGRGGGGMLRFWLFTCLGGLMYTAIVPFWFYGGAFIRDKWGYSLEAADALMLFPEGGMVVLSPPIGITIDRLASSPRSRAAALAGSMCCVVAGFLLLVGLPASSLPPLVPLAVLGVAWAASNTLFWSLSSMMVPERWYAICGGIIGAALNLGPTALPVVMARAPSAALALLWPTVAAALAAPLALAAAALAAPAAPAESAAAP